LINFWSFATKLTNDSQRINEGKNMTLKTSDLKENFDYFVSKPDVVLREEKTGAGKVNHLLLGDWLRYLGESHVHKRTTSGGTIKSATYVHVRCRGDEGWLKIDEFGEERALEVNFVDIGQGDGCHIVTPDDKIILIDAGISDNMIRFLSWRYNLRKRNVKRAEDFDPSKKVQAPWPIDYVVISHPDEDHYGGFAPIFSNPKLKFSKVFHNGIVERPKEKAVAGVKFPDDLGGVFEAGDKKFLFDLVTDADDLKKLVDAHPTTRKRLISTLRKLFENSPNAKVKAVGVEMDNLGAEVYLESFGKSKSFSLQILGPIRERKKFKTKHRETVRLLGSEGVTKNGHSVIFKARFGKLNLLLGGDLNSQAQNFLLQSYAGTKDTPEKLEKEIAKLHNKKQPLKPADQTRLGELEKELAKTEKAGKDQFESDVAKACHHGSQHIIDGFVRSVNAVATVISSGDNEQHSHPRPDALGAYGKLGRGKRPLIFSTELARSTNEFTPQLKNYLALRGITLQIEAETDAKKKAALLKTLEDKRDRNVAVYGMITLRALEDKVIIAQKLEVPRSASQKWDIYELEYDEAKEQFAYHGH
jgi:beta-lactamase superfamily II metal-dependent hydrolase